MMTTKSWPRLILRGLLFSLFGTICFIQCFSIMKSYFQYPVTIDMYDATPGLASILPGITICNNNRYSLKKLMVRNPHIGKAILEMFPDWYHHQKPQIGLKNFDNFRDELFKIYKAYNYTPQYELDNTTLADLFELKPKSEVFISYLGCAQAWADSVECGQLSRIESVQDRRCTTLMHKGATAYDYKTKPFLFNSIANRTLDLPYGFFDARDVTKMIINFDPEDYGDLKRQVGARIVFHSNNFVASFNELDFFVTRGYRYDFNIDREVILLLDKPYMGCWPYEEKNLAKFNESINPRVPLDVNTCFQNCVIINSIHRLDCWPPTMPYFRNDPLDPMKKYKACTWAKDTLYSTLYGEMLRVLKIKNITKQQAARNGSYTIKENPDDANEKSNAQTRLFQKIRRHCWRKCMANCRLTRYTVSVSKSIWPTDLRISLDKSGKNLHRRHCCALVTVRYPHFHHSVQELLPKYNLIDTIGNIGGLLAVWMGLSVVSIYHAIQKMYEIFKSRSSLSNKISAFNYPAYLQSKLHLNTFELSSKCSTLDANKINNLRPLVKKGT